MTTGTSVPTVYVTQSEVTDPGSHAALIDAVPDSLAAIRDTARQLVFHYRAGGDWAEHSIAPERIREIDTRYADRMWARLVELKDAPLTEPRLPRERLVGCCRDVTVLFLSMARHKGIPARMRVGFATYFAPGWNVDHAVAEVWDAAEGRWRLVDAELDPGHVDPTDGTPIDPLDIPRDRFITGPQAWLACRAEEADPERYVVAPDLDIPQTRGWPYLMHNVMHDLAAMYGREMILWDTWGLMLGETAMLPDHLALLDHVAETLMAPDASPETLRESYERDELRVPETVLSFTAASETPRQVHLTR